LVDLLWADVAIVVEGIEAFAECLLAVGAEIALMTIGYLAVFMSLRMTTEPTFHRLSLGVGVVLLYQTHILLMHNPRKSQI
jgi:hypothetical protein